MRTTEIELDRITLCSGKEFPLICDLAVLEKLQEEYDYAINEFERDILGLIPRKDDNGGLMYNDDGSLILMQGAPRIRALSIGLTLMINEGMRLEAYKKGGKAKSYTEEEIVYLCKIPFMNLSAMLHEEFMKCFSSKKKLTYPARKAQNRKRKS